MSGNHVNIPENHEIPKHNLHVDHVSGMHMHTSVQIRLVCILYIFEYISGLAVSALTQMCAWNTAVCV